MKPLAVADHVDDIQAMLASGFGWLHGSRFSLLTIRDAGGTRNWLRALRASGLVKSAAGLCADGGSPSRSVHEVAAVAFSAAGLRLLGLPDCDDARFPTPFAGGMGSTLRETLLRDLPREPWSWSDVAHDGRREAHILVAHWWRLGASSAMPAFDAAAFDVESIAGSPGSFRDGKLFEPFGFRDGLSQPRIRGLRTEPADRLAQVIEDAGATYDDRVVAPGEFLLGHLNEYGEPASAFDVRGWRDAHPGSAFGLNGAFLAVRQIDQHVEAFTKLRAIPAGTAGGAAVTLDEKLVGRRRDDHGTPLGWRGPACPVSDSQADAFRYARDDAHGFDCPLGAHVRRAQPRDGLGHDVPAGIESSKLHRLLRRGRPYCESHEGGLRQGLFFIACNADLERQFEFVHQRWMHNPRFADLEAEDDPMLGAARGDPNRPFTVPARPVGRTQSLMADYTTTVGGGYFFLPGMRALAFVAGG